MKPTLVSVMMPAFNAEAFVAQAIESLLAQSYKAWQLIVVNDGSSDRTGEIAGKFRDARITVIHQSNLGEASARNTALLHSQGEYLAFLDADDLYLPSHLERCIAHLETHPDHDGAYTDGIYIDQHGSPLKTLSSRRRGPFQGDIFEQMVRASDVFGTPACVVLRKQAAGSRDLTFDPEIVIGPDWDFLTRFSERAWFGYVDLQTCLYRVHTGNVSLRTSQEKRLQSLARCREKAVKLSRFESCSVETRAHVFYDLLANLLTGHPERQQEITRWPEFLSLPAGERARLFRLMASRALVSGVDPRIAGGWLRASRLLSPADKKTWTLTALFGLRPQLCRKLLSLRISKHTPAAANPFADLA